MAELINLRGQRKAAARRAAETVAAANRARFGRPKAERRKEQADVDKAARELAGKKLD
jgi:hypothetical protein